MAQNQHTLSPLDIVILLKIVSLGEEPWRQSQVAEALDISQSEVSKSLNRSKYAGLLDPSGRIVMTRALLEFLEAGLRYVFPQKPGPMVRGVPTSHSAFPLKDLIHSTENYVWPYAKGNLRGQSIVPLYPTVPGSALKDERLYALLALTDALRVGRSREKQIAGFELKKRFGLGE